VSNAGETRKGVRPVAAAATLGLLLYTTPAGIAPVAGVAEDVSSTRTARTVFLYCRKRFSDLQPVTQSALRAMAARKK
jgi:hypothetical protein